MNYNERSSLTQFKKNNIIITLPSPMSASPFPPLIEVVSILNFVFIVLLLFFILLPYMFVSLKDHLFSFVPFNLYAQEIIL